MEIQEIANLQGKIRAILSNKIFRDCKFARKDKEHFCQIKILENFGFGVKIYWMSKNIFVEIFFCIK